MSPPPIIDRARPSLCCSDECAAGPKINYNPEHHGPLTAATAALLHLAEEIPRNSSIISSPDGETSSDLSKAPSLTTTPAVIQSKSQSGHIPSGYAALASIYDLPPCPPPPPFQPDPKPKPTIESPADEYTSGIIMVARRMQSILGRPEVQRTTQMVIPGWTDGSNKWRASVYSFARPSEDVDVSSDGVFDNRNNAYRGFVSTPCRSRRSHISGRATPQTPQTLARAHSEAKELYSKWDMSFADRCESRAKMFPNYASKISRGILKKGAEGLLLVPDVQMKRRDPTISIDRSLMRKQGGERLRSGLSEKTNGGSIRQGDSGIDSSTKKAHSSSMTCK